MVDAANGERRRAWRAAAQEVIAVEQEALAELKDGIDDSFADAVQLLLQARGKIICTGVGKSGHIARKAAATFASTGAPAFFVHPSEAGHGDLGMIGGGDAVLAISYSGESEELLSLLPPLGQMGIPLLALTGAPNSTLARAANVVLSAAVAKEACPHNLAPTASTTVSLALTDALAIVLLRARGFSADDFARSHPAGVLGRRLLLRVRDVMRSGGEVPVVGERAEFSEVLLEMTGKRMGMVLIADAQSRLRGIFTDGDLRRAVAQKKDFSSSCAGELMTPSPHAVAASVLAGEAARQMREKSVNHLAVVEEGRIIGALSFHDLLHHRLL